MKLILSLSLFFAFSAQAADTLYCKWNGRVLDALKSEDDTWNFNKTCEEAFYTGDLCFTGSRKPIVERLNSSDRIGDDENWVGKAKYHGRNIRYTAVDGPNEISTNYIVKRCTNEFFRDSVPEQLPLFPDLEQKKDIKALKAYFDLIQVGNGEMDTRRYNVNSVDVEVEKLIASNRAATAKDEDPYLIEQNPKYAASDLIRWHSDIGEHPENVAEDFGKLLQRMIKTKSVLRMFSVSPPESCDQSEYCNWQVFEIFLLDGTHYHLNIDYTT
jgi:hypothetical protein